MNKLEFHTFYKTIYTSNENNLSERVNAFLTRLYDKDVPESAIRVEFVTNRTESSAYLVAVISYRIFGENINEEAC